MRTSPYHHRARLLGAVCLALAAAALGALSLMRKVESFQPLGFEAAEQAGHYTVTAVADPGTGLAAGDRILLVGGAVPASGADLRNRLTTERESTVATLRGDGVINVSYQRPPLDWDFAYLALALSGMVYLVIGLYALIQARRRPAGLFFLWCLSSAVVYLFSFVPAASPDAVAKSLFVLEEAARIVLPALTLHLFLLFPWQLLPDRRHRVVAPFVYLPSAALAALQADLILFDGRWLVGGVSPFAIDAIDRVELLLLVASAVASVAILLWRLGNRDDWREQRQLQWITAGLAAGYLPFLALYLVPWGLTLQWPEWTTVAAVAPLSLVPLSFAWAILRYKLWDLEIILRDAVSYTATLMLGVLSFSVLQLLIDRGLSDEQQLARNVLTFVTGLALAGVLIPAHRGVRDGLERLRNPASFARRRALKRLGDELLEERHLDELGSRLLEHLEAGLGLQKVNLYLFEGEGRLAPVAPEAMLPTLLASGDLGDGFWRRSSIRLSPVDLPGGSPTAMEQFFLVGYRNAFPLTLQGRPVGILLASHRADGLPLNSEEIDLVRALSNQAALALENAQLVNALQRQLDEVTHLKQYSERILESSPAGIVVVDDDERIVSANHAFADLAGRGGAELVGRRMAEVLPIKAYPEADGAIVEMSYCDAGGTERYLQLSSSATAGGDQRVLVVQDVTERFALQRALEEKERLAALGMLAAGVAHEVNTPITGISSYAQMLLAETDADDPRYQLLQKVERQTFRAARIVNNLLEFARQRRQDLEPVSVAAVMRDSLEATDDKLRDHPIEVAWEIDGPATVRAGFSELQQVFTNLIANAADAMAPAGGRLTLRVESENGRVLATVEDTGKGISPAEMAKIFQPFYSTKLGRGGTGLGLSISHQIVQRFDGELRVESTPGDGSRFIVDLPAHHASAEAMA